MTNLSITEIMRRMAWNLREIDRLQDPRAPLKPPQSLEDYLYECERDEANLGTLRRYRQDEQEATGVNSEILQEEINVDHSKE